MIIEIKYIISCGRRCTTNQFLNKYKLKSFSTPFSSIFCDFETAIFFINTKFKDFLNVKFIENHNYKQMFHWRFAPKFYYNYNIIKKFEDKLNFNNLERLLIWTHFDPIKDKKLIERRCDRINNIIKNNENSKILLFYIDKIRNYNDCENIKNNILCIINKYNIFENILYIIPCQDIIEECNLYFNNERLHIFLLKVTKINDLINETYKQKKYKLNKRPLLDADIEDINNNYNLLYKKIKSIYKFL